MGCDIILNKEIKKLFFQYSDATTLNSMIRFLIENEFSEIKITETKNCIKFDYVQKGEKYSRIFSVIDDSLRIKDKREL